MKKILGIFAIVFAFSFQVNAQTQPNSIQILKNKSDSLWYKMVKIVEISRETCELSEKDSPLLKELWKEYIQTNQELHYLVQRSWNLMMHVSNINYNISKITPPDMGGSPVDWSRPID